ncbi:MAG: hypothetical protein ACRD4R_02780 [Candidatus Acidiferrales bacterium]
MRARFFYLVLLLCLSASVPGFASAARSKALGSVVQANNSMVDNQTAMAGGDVYACDVLDSDTYGSLRVQFSGSQILLSPSSEVVLDGQPNAVRVIVINGSTSFSATSSAVLEIDTPAGVVRESSGQFYSGSVTITGPKELVVSANRGDLVFNNGGELHTVLAGKSARVTFDHAADASCHKPGYIRTAEDRRKIGFYILGGAGGGVAGYFAWKALTESPTKPN